MSRPTTSIFAPRTFCSRPCRSSAAPWFSSPTTATSLTSWRRASSRSPRKKVNTFKLKQLQDRCAHLEALVSSTEVAIAECEAALQTFVSADETIRLTQLLAQRRADLQRLIGEWEEASLALEGA